MKTKLNLKKKKKNIWTQFCLIYVYDECGGIDNEMNLLNGCPNTLTKIPYQLLNIFSIQYVR